MSDKLQLVTLAASAGRTGWQALEFIRGLAGADAISTYFSWDGTRLDGDSRIEVRRRPGEANPDLYWWFEVLPVTDYVFTRHAVNDVAIELVGILTGKSVEHSAPDARYWCWVAPRPPGQIENVGTRQPNLRVEFIVVGYKPRALLRHFSSK